MKRAVWAAAALWLALLPCCGAAETFTDALGRRVEVPAPPQRAVALEGSLADAFLLCGGTLVGTTQDAISERKLALGEDVAAVGTVNNPSLELTFAQEPDFILLSADNASHVSLAKTLETLGVPFAYFTANTREDYMATVETLCRVNGREELIDAQRQAVEAPVDELLSRVRQDERYGRRTALLLRAYSSGVRAKGSDNLAGAVLRDMGLVNIAEREGAVLEAITLEQIVADDPDYIFITTMGSSYEKAMEALAEELTGHPAWGTLTAVKEGRVYELPRDLFHYKPNARWAEAYALIEELVYAK